MCLVGLCFSSFWGREAFFTTASLVGKIYYFTLVWLHITFASAFRNFSSLTQQARNCFLRCWINWQVQHKSHHSAEKPRSKPNPCILIKAWARTQNDSFCLPFCYYYFLKNFRANSKMFSNQRKQKKNVFISVNVAIKYPHGERLAFLPKAWSNVEKAIPKKKETWGREPVP